MGFRNPLTLEDTLEAATEAFTTADNIVRAEIGAAVGQVITTAENAASVAGTAAAAAKASMEAASAAGTAAAAVPRIYHATTTPAGTAPKGSTWFRHRDTLAGAVIGQWTQTADGIAATWTPSVLANEVIAGLDVGKLTAGASVVVEQVAQAIWAAKVNAELVRASEVLIGSMNLLQYVPGRADSVNGLGEKATHVITDNSRQCFRIGYDTTDTAMRYSSLRPYATYAIGDLALGDVLALSFRAAKGGGLGGGTQTPNNLTATVRIQSDQGYAVISNTVSISLLGGFYDYAGELTVTTDPATAAATNGSGVVANGTNARIFVHVEQAYPAGTSGWVWLNSVRITRKMTANLIVDGAITARSLAADAIDGKTIRGVVIEGGEVRGANFFGGGLLLYPQNTASTARMLLGASASGEAAWTAYHSSGMYTQVTLTPPTSNPGGGTPTYGGKVTVLADEVNVTGQLKSAGRSVLTDYLDTSTPTLTGIASGWTVSVQLCRRRAGMCHLTLTLTPTAAIAAGNIADIAICTLAAGFRPVSLVHAVQANTLAGLTLSNAGVVSLNTLAYPWSAGTALGVTFVFMY